jgi:hypothetical protein
VHLQASTTNSQASKTNLHGAQMQTRLGSLQKGFSPIGSGLTNGHGNNKIGCNGRDEKFPTSCQKHDDLEHTKMLTLIFCKHAKHTTSREFIDP